MLVIRSIAPSSQVVKFDDPLLHFRVVAPVCVVDAPPAHEEDGAVGGAGAQLPHQLPARLAAAAEHQRDQTGRVAEPGTCPSNIRTPMWGENYEAQK